MSILGSNFQELAEQLDVEATVIKTSKEWKAAALALFCLRGVRRFFVKDNAGKGVSKEEPEEKKVDHPAVKSDM